MPEGFVELRLDQTQNDSQSAFPGTRAALEEVIGAPLQAAQPAEMTGRSQRPPERAPHRAYLAQDPREHYAQELPPSFADSLTVLSQHSHKQQQQQQRRRRRRSTASDADIGMGTDTQLSSPGLPGVYLNPDTLLPMEHKQPAPSAWYDVSQYLWAQAQGAEGKGINAPPQQAGGGLRIQSGEIAL